MLALVLMDHYLRLRAQCADVVSTTPVITARADGAPPAGSVDPTRESETGL